MAVMTTIQPTIKVSDEQIAFFHREGYLAIPAITTQAEVETLRGIYDRLFNSNAGREEGNQFDLGGTDEDGKTAKLPQILNPVKYAPELQDTLFRANAAAISRQLLGEGCQGRGEHAILKPAHYGSETPWHQDEAYWSPDFEYTSLSVWMPLQEATLANGCLQFVPRSHTWPVHPHHTINNDPRIHGLEIDNPQQFSKGAVACPLPAGGATFHYNRTLHYAGPNLSDIPRRAYILGFGLENRKSPTVRDFYWNRTKQTPRQERYEAKKKISEC
jgi:ectoine hydroxylase-related dioxygenase (phytanoyl-CoA dioxygenase family)